MASKIYRQWREHFQQTGKRLPDTIRDEITSRQSWDADKAKFIEARLTWLEANPAPELVADAVRRLDAFLEYTIFVAREMLLRNYNVEKHDSDVYDQFQLQYLAMDRFVIVTEDADFPTRAARSNQAGRILSFQRFLQSL